MRANYYWDGNQWIGASKYEYIFDENYLLSELLVPEKDWYDFDGMILEEKFISWDKDEMDWKAIAETFTYHYSSANVSVKNIYHTQNVKIYPNPVKL